MSFPMTRRTPSPGRRSTAAQRRPRRCLSGGGEVSEQTVDLRRIAAWSVETPPRRRRARRPPPSGRPVPPLRTATPFQAYAWLESWWRAYGEPGRLRLSGAAGRPAGRARPRSCCVAGRMRGADPARRPVLRLHRRARRRRHRGRGGGASWPRPCARARLAGRRLPGDPARRRRRHGAAGGRLARRAQRAIPPRLALPGTAGDRDSRSWSRTCRRTPARPCGAGSTSSRSWPRRARGGAGRRAAGRRRPAAAARGAVAGPRRSTRSTCGRRSPRTSRRPSAA